jgi:hypothetical protein
MGLDNTFIRNAVENVNRINGNKTLLDMLLEFEKVLDDTGIYAYKNWMSGEVVEGPILERHWFNVTLMYPRKGMPDPDAIRRLDKYGCKVDFVKEEIEVPVRVKGVEDLKDLRTKEPKMEAQQVWLVKIEMPRRFLETFDDRSLEVAGQKLDIAAVNKANIEGLDDADATKNEQTDVENNIEQAEPLAPAATPAA